MGSFRARRIGVAILAALALAAGPLAVPAMAEETATVSGTVTFPAGTDLEAGWTDVEVYPADDPLSVAGSSSVDSDGVFVVEGLAAGSYKVRFAPAWLGLAQEWWSDAADHSSATTVEVSAGEWRAEVDATLSAGAGISGTVTGGAVEDGFGLARAYRQTSTGGWEYEGSADIDSSGTYTIGALRPGTYSVSFTDRAGFGWDEAGDEYSSWVEWWDDSVDRASADLIVLAADERRTSVDVDLDTIDEQVSWPVISGTAQVTRTLTMTDGVWPSGMALKRQWSADGDAIAGATGTTLGLTADLLGKRISVDVWGRTGPATGYTTWIGKQSANTDPIAAAPVPPLKTLTAPTPTISGTVAYGSKLTVKPGTWTSGTTLTYRWYANGASIAGATKSTFTLGTAQKSKTISVSVTGKKTGYATATKTSKATAKVLTAGTPTISGTAKVGATLTAKRGTWTASTTFSYQWYASGKAISKATKSTYKVTGSQRGKTITVKVTGKRSGYATVAKTSKATARVK